MGCAASQDKRGKNARDVQMTERPLIDEIMLGASKIGARLFRQNTGLGWVGRIAGKTAKTITLENPRPLHAGLCTGSSDVIGIMPVIVTPEMVGRTVGLFVAIEVKTGNVPVSQEQARFLAMVRDCGGVAMLAKSAPDALAALQKQTAPEG
jgi:hypothetical protein